LDDIKTEFRQVFSGLKFHNNTKGGKETAIVARTPGKGKFKKTFKGDCRHCGKKGHKSTDCWEKPENKDKCPSDWQSKKKNEAAHVAKTNTNTYHFGYCNKDGHTEDRCFKKKRDKEQKPPDTEMAFCIYETALIAKAKTDGILTDYTFITDSGASSHMVYSKKFLTNIEPCSTEATVGNDDIMQCTAKGTFRGHYVKDNGDKITLTLTDVLYVPDLSVNLLSITTCIGHKHVSLEGTSNYLALNFNGQQLKFGKELTHGSGKLYAVDIIPNYSHETALIAISYNKFHSMLGHPNHQTLQETAKHQGIILTDIPKDPCPHCLQAKIRKKNFPRVSNTHATRKAERLFIDLSWIKTASVANNTFWILVIDYTHFLWSLYLKTKDQLPTTVINLILKIQ
jgi:hypothetical protein